MKKLLFLFALVASSLASWAQSKGYIVNDSTYFEKRGGNAEVIIENGTKDTLGFLYNKAGGRTIFKRALIKIDDTTYIIGHDTLHTNRGIDSTIITYIGDGSPKIPIIYTSPDGNIRSPYMVPDPDGFIIPFRNADSSFGARLDTAMAATWLGIIARYGPGVGGNIYTIDGTLPGDRHVSMSGTHRLFLDSTFSFEILTQNGVGTPIASFRVGNNAGTSEVSIGDVDNAAGGTRLIVDDPNLQVAIFTQGVFKFRGQSGASNPVDLKTQAAAPEYTLYFPTSENYFQLDTLARLKDVRDLIATGGSGFADPLTTNGDILARISGVTTRKAKGSDGTYLGVRSGTLDYYAPSDAELSTSNITTNNATTSKHGFLPILPNDATKYIDGTGTWSTPSGTSYSVTTAANTGNYTVPSGRKIFVTLSDLTGQANRNVVLPASPTTGDEAVFKNINTSAFAWTFTVGTVKDNTNTSVTILDNQSVYQLVFDGTNWDIK